MLKDLVYTVFDFETTGLFPYGGDRICEIAAVRVEPGKRKKKWHSMVNPGRPISRGAFMVNRITPDMLKGAPVIRDVLPGFMRFMENSVLVAYNAGFDVGFLECALGPEKRVLDDYCVVDALKLARRLFPEAGRYNLASVADFLGLKSEREHRAMFDAEMTLGIFQKELKILIKNGIRTVEQIAESRRAKDPETGLTLAKVKDYKTGLIQEAIREQRKLNIVYRSSWRDRVTERTVTPKSLEKRYDTSYLVAYCHLRNSERNFRLDSIVRAEIADA
ncbi:MAG: exonuclease domain-containing protein [Candidatus Omnitrophota bacterium]